MPNDVVKDMSEIAPMLAMLGYDPNANPPNYGTADALVQQNMKHLEKNQEDWYAKQKEMMSIRESIRSSLVKQKANNNNVDNNVVDVIHQSNDDLDKTVGPLQSITWFGDMIKSTIFVEKY